MYFSGVQLLESSIIIAIQLKLSLVTEIAFFFDYRYDFSVSNITLSL